MKQKLTKRLLYWQKLSDLLMLLLRYTFHTHFNSTQHDAVVLYAVAKQMKDEMPPRAYYALWYAPSKRSRNNQEKQ